MTLGILYLLLGTGLGLMAWDRHAPDSQNFATFSIAVLIWPLVLVVGLIVAGVRLAKK